jgi:hypothetical protein
MGYSLSHSPEAINPMRPFLSILSHLGAFALAAFLLSFALLLAGALAELIYKFGLPDHSSF